MWTITLLVCACPLLIASLELFPNSHDGSVHIPAGTHTIPGINQDLKFEVTKDIKITDLEKMDHIDARIVDSIKIGTGTEYEPNGELSCLHFIKRMVMKALPAFNTCMLDMDLTMGKIKRNLRKVLPCLVKCVGIKMHLLEEDGSFNAENTKAFILDTVPPRLLDHVWKIWDTCIDLAQTIDPSDPTCDSYRPALKCTMDAAFKMAAEILQLCPDIPKEFQIVISSKGLRKSIGKYIDP